MGLHGTGLELGVEVAGQEPGMVGEFHDFHEFAIGRGAGNDKAFFHKEVTEGVVEFVAVAMAFGSDFHTVGGSGQRVGSDGAGVCSEAEVRTLIAGFVLEFLG